MQGRILVVEDDQLQQSVLQAALRSRGHEVDVVSDGLEAVWKIRAGSYDLVLIDYQLPEIDGLATARLIVDLMGEAARPRMIALTARPDTLLNRVGGPDQVFDGVITKSGNIPALLAIVDQHMQAAPNSEARHAAEAELLLKDWVEFESAPPRPGVRPDHPATARILVVEDDPLQQSVLRSALAKTGYEVEATADGLDAVRRIREGTFDLVLVDYMTPEIDGLAAARLVGALMSEAARPRMIALTATPERLRQWEAASGKVFDEIVGKSANLPTLLSTVSRALRAPVEA